MADSRTICDVFNYSIVFVELMNIIHCTAVHGIQNLSEAEVMTVVDLDSQ